MKKSKKNLKNLDEIFYECRKNSWKLFLFLQCFFSVFVEYLVWNSEKQEIKQFTSPSQSSVPTASLFYTRIFRSNSTSTERENGNKIFHLIACVLRFTLLDIPKDVCCTIIYILRTFSSVLNSSLLHSFRSSPLLQLLHFHSFVHYQFNEVCCF